MPHTFGATLSTVALVLLVTACGDDPTPPAPQATSPEPPARAEAASPLVELTMSGIGTAAPTSSVRILPGSVQPEVFAPRARPQVRQIRKEILRTPWGQSLDFAPDGGWRKLGREVSATRQA